MIENVRMNLEHIVQAMQSGGEGSLDSTYSAMQQICRELGGDAHVIYAGSPAFAMSYVLALILARTP